MTYNLKFHQKALKEWNKLDKSIREQFKKKIKERLNNPEVPKDKLSGFENVYKIKLKNAGFRLAYEVLNEEIVIIVLCVAKRENDKIYKLLQSRFDENNDI